MMFSDVLESWTVVVALYEMEEKTEHHSPSNVEIWKRWKIEKKK